MHDVLIALTDLVAGALLGAMFFGGLWWTVLRTATSTQPGLWVLSSLLLRLGLTLAGFWLVGAGDWKRLLLCLVGFLLARGVATWLAQPATSPRRRIRNGDQDAP
jgi:F1F0 ATPase subunit 2